MARDLEERKMPDTDILKRRIRLREQEQRKKGKPLVDRLGVLDFGQGLPSCGSCIAQNNGELPCEDKPRCIHR